ncbi:MFS transporter [Arenivirga flava]|uniref:MFS transporter n=1 Tax=Arenivirga flava TaxID=1930060 RepID=A0AA37UF66_9MICO|nr:MFS transporter [Arenivirga flava]GMA26981.1 MFS transporter [Arenivirga flava]
MTSVQRLVLVIAVLGSFVAFLDGSIVSVALPAIREELGGGLAAQQWVIDGYLLSLSALILLAGSLSDLLGRRRVLALGLWGFGAASVLIAVAPSIELLVAGRVLQGVAGALLVPSSLALITQTFSGPAQAAAIGQWTAWTSGAFIAGPLLGGLFVDLGSWRWAFAVNVLPIAATLLALARLRRLDAAEERMRGVRIDWAGAVLGAVGLGATVVALIEQGSLGWTHPLVLIPLVVGVLALVGFVVRQATAAQPMVPLELFRSRNVAAGNLATLFVYGALGIGTLIVALYLQEVGGWSATLAGLAILPVTVLNIALAPVAGRLHGRYGPRWFMAGGPALAAAGFLLMTGAGERPDYWLGLLPGLVLFGIGLGLTVTPLTAAVLGGAPAGRSGIVSAVNNAVARVAGLITVALLGVIAGAEVFDADGFRRTALATAALLAVGAVVSAVGIENPRRTRA